MNIWQTKLQLGFGDTDRSARLTLSSVFDFFQEAATFHAETLGMGKEALEAARQGWILSRMSVVVEKRPRYKDLITVRSWPRGSERLFAVRDYDIRDDADRPLVRARSGWLIWDIDKRRPLRLQSLVEKLPLNEGLDALPAFRALDTREGLIPAGERRAAYSDLDSNGHVNNARYIQWVQDVTEPEILERADSMDFDINYIAEVRPGETITLFSGPIAGEAGTFAYEGRRGDGMAVFRAELQLS
ncbi:MAG: acyl-ACP thioesterase [Treponema sp.]|jgi:acyl-ACP thioesterase|nr:acyl-ACP thioesterase [Treponema sp.]